MSSSSSACSRAFFLGTPVSTGTVAMLSITREVRQQPGVLHHVADAAAQLRRDRVASDASPSISIVAAGRLDHAVDHAQQRGLAAAGRADEAPWSCATGMTRLKSSTATRAVGELLGDDLNSIIRAFERIARSPQSTGLEMPESLQWQAKMKAQVRLAATAYSDARAGHRSVHVQRLEPAAESVDLQLERGLRVARQEGERRPRPRHHAGERAGLLAELERVAQLGRSDSAAACRSLRTCSASATGSPARSACSTPGSTSGARASRTMMSVPCVARSASRCA